MAHKSDEDRQFAIKIRKLCEASSFHGLSNLARTDRWFVKFIWLACFLVSLAFCSIEIVNSLIDYFEYNVVITVQTVHETSVNFPAITVCNLNSIDYSNPGVADELSAIIARFDEKANSTADILKHSKLKLKEISYLINNEIKNRSYYYSIEDMLISCLFNNQPCGPNDFEPYESKNFKSCYTFNSGTRGHVLASNRAGMNNGLELELYVGNIRHQPYWVSTFGALITIYNQSTKPMLVEQGIKLKTGVETQIIVSRHFTQMLGKPYSDCLNLNELKSSYAASASASFKMTQNIYQNYTQRFCLSVCLQNIIVRTCNCTDLSSTVQSRESIEPCLSDAQLTCLRKLTDAYHADSGLKNKCTSECPVRCESYSFGKIISMAEYPTFNYTEYLKSLSELKKDHPIRKEYSFDELRKNIMAINIYYDSLSYQITKEKPATYLMNLISSTGGTLGLFLGISLLSFIEVIELLIELAISFLFPKKALIQVKHASNNK